MPVKVQCPACSKELSAPDDMVGKTVACPRCSMRFPVGDNGGGPTQNMYPPGTNLFPPGFEPPQEENRQDSPTTPVPPAPPEPAAQSSPSGTARFLGPPADGEGGAAQFIGPPPVEESGAAKFTGPPSAETDGTAKPAPNQIAPLPPNNPPPLPTEQRASMQAPPSGPRQSGKPKPVPIPPPPGDATEKASASAAQGQGVTRKKQAAKFVTAGNSASHVRLGADGQLPQLVLQEGEKRERRSEEKQGMNPLVLVAVLALSLASTAAILFIPDASPAVSQFKNDARRVVEDYYIGKGENIRPYQEHLREALQAHRRGDYNLEQRKYRQVMNMLKYEGLGLTGLTGRRGTQEVPPPNDYDLEEQLRILLR